MPWKDVKVSDQRLSVVLAMLRDQASVVDLASAAGVSRKTAYKWLARFKSGGEPALANLSHARHEQAGQVEPSIRNLVVDERRAHPTWGPKKLLPALRKRYPNMAFPSPSTASLILDDAGLVKPGSPRRAKPTRAVTCTDDPTGPNHTWTIDFKGQFRLGSGTLCYPLTIVDRWSRFIFLIDALRSTHGEPVRAHLERLFREFGLPERIRSDNGSPFASTGLSRLSALSVWWISLDILPDLIDPGCPGQNGRHERMHRVLKAETTRPPGQDFAQQQTKFSSFVCEYNQLRVHEAIHFVVPASLYQPSPRPYKPVTKADDAECYQRHWERRSVKPSGAIKWRNRMVYLSMALAGRTVGLVETDDGVWTVKYRHVAVGMLDARSNPAKVRGLLSQVPKETAGLNEPSADGGSAPTPPGFTECGKSM